jgi:hypothetical protein
MKTKNNVLIGHLNLDIKSDKDLIKESEIKQQVKKKFKNLKILITKKKKKNFFIKLNNRITKIIQILKKKLINFQDKILFYS